MFKTLKHTHFLHVLNFLNFPRYWGRRRRSSSRSIDVGNLIEAPTRRWSARNPEGTAIVRGLLLGIVFLGGYVLRDFVMFIVLFWRLSFFCFCFWLHPLASPTDILLMIEPLGIVHQMYPCVGMVTWAPPIMDPNSPMYLAYGIVATFLFLMIHHLFKSHCWFPACFICAQYLWQLVVHRGGPTTNLQWSF